MKTIYFNKNKLVCVFLSIFAIYGLSSFFHISSLFISAILFAFLYWIIDAVGLGLKEKKAWLIFGVVFSVSQVIAEKVRYTQGPEHFKSFGLSDIISVLSLFVFIVFFSALLERKIDSTTYPVEEKIVSNKVWLITAAIIFTCWLPYYLIYFPGDIQPDSLSSISQALGHQTYTNHHPICFTLLIKLFVSIGSLVNNINFGVGLFSLFQMIFTAFTLSRVVLLFFRNNKKILAVASLLFFALNPIIAVYSISMVKDVIFTDLLVLFVLFVVKIVSTKAEVMSQKIFVVTFLLLSVIVCLFRNGTIIIVLGTLIVLLLFYRKLWKRFLAALFAVLIFVEVIQLSLFGALNVEKGHFAESVGILLQQISYVVVNDGNLSESDIQDIEKIVPVSTIKEKYSPALSDPVKFSEDFDNQYLDSNKTGFMLLWLRIGFKNISKYLKSWIISTKSFYDISNKGVTAEYTVYDNDIGITEKNLILQLTGIDLSSITEKAITYPSEANIPILSCLNSIPCLVWFAFYVVVLLIRRKKAVLIAVLAPIILDFVMMLIAAPCFDSRYLLIYIFSLPIVVGIAIGGINDTKILKKN